jgi:glyceraldehyde 3-phosphate dehydrogenase
MRRCSINGFGRTGRAAFRAAYQRELDIEWAAINDVAEPAMLAHLLRYDSVYGLFAGTVEVADSAILVDGLRIETPRMTDPVLGTGWALPKTRSASTPTGACSTSSPG